jgi:hypothetical protein
VRSRAPHPHVVNVLHSYPFLTRSLVKAERQKQFATQEAREQPELAFFQNILALDIQVLKSKALLHRELLPVPFPSPFTNSLPIP